MRYCWFSLSLTNSCKQSYPQPQAVILISKKLRTVNSIFFNLLINKLKIKIPFCRVDHLTILFVLNRNAFLFLFTSCG
ncbi:hypothetical protein BON63_12675 [Escherichia coli]|nr:hypothetical protein BON63_12675 [Escherichia coli]